MGRLRIDRIAGPPATLRAGDGRILCARCHPAAGARARLVGLLATPDLGPDEGVWFGRCSSVHAFGLRAPIGCAFLDGGGRVVRVVDPLPRWTVASARGARSVVECRTGVLSGVAVGEVLHLCP